MSSAARLGHSLAAVVLLTALLAARGPAEPAPVPAASALIPPSPDVASTPTTPATPSALPPPPTKPAEGPAPAPAVGVQVTALGTVYIRRGPDMAFNPVGSLTKGSTAKATGRDVLSHWLQVPLPADESSYGWISIISEFTEVSGELDSLNEINPQEWPELASIRNCTNHELWINPVGLTLPPVYEFPNNDLRLNPGLYTIVDVDVDGYPEILQADLSEGMTIEVLIDGSGEKKKCPPP